MNIKLKTEISKQVKKDTVEFLIAFSCVEETSKLALKNVTRDIDKCVETYRSKLGLTESQLYVSYINVTENKVWREVEVENPRTFIKELKRELFKEGYKAYGYIGISLPLTWADETHKFSSIYVIAEKCKYKTSISYNYELENIEKYMEELRGELLTQSKKEVLQIVGKVVYEKNLKIADVFYHVESNTPMRYNAARMCEEASFGAAPENEDPDLAILDNLISVEAAPMQELSDSIEVVWSYEEI